MIRSTIASAARPAQGSSKEGQFDSGSRIWDDKPDQECPSHRMRT